MAKKNVTEEARLLSNSIESWAQSNKAQDDIYVKQLLDSLKDKKNWPMWAALDPLEFLPQPKFQGSVRIIRITFILTVIRNGLVFLPVALTWLAISKATQAFAIYSTKNPNGVANFLDFWQKGYGILGKEWSIGNVAFLDFLIILLIIGMTVTTTILGRHSQEVRELKLMELDHDRTALALEISEFFFDKKQITNVTMNASLAKAIRDLLNSTESISKTTKELNQTVKSLPKYKELFSEIKGIKLNLTSRFRNQD